MALHGQGTACCLACHGRPGCGRRSHRRGFRTWLKETTFFDTPLSALPSPAARLGANLLVTGQRGGHDLHRRTLQTTGVQLPDLFFCGVHFLRKRKSSVLFGVGEDAAVVGQSIAHHRSQHHTAASNA